MGPTDITVEILKEIRDGVRATNARLDQTNARLDQTNARLEGVEQGVKNLEGGLTNVREGLHGVELGLRELATQPGFVVRWLKAGTRRDRDLEQEIEALDARVTALEGRTER